MIPSVNRNKSKAHNTAFFMMTIASLFCILEKSPELIILLQKSPLISEKMDIISVSEKAQNNLLALSQFEKIVSFAVIGMNVFLGVFYWALLFKNVWRHGWGGPPINFMTGNFFFHYTDFLQICNPIHSSCDLFFSHR